VSELHKLSTPTPNWYSVIYTRQKLGASCPVYSRSRHEESTISLVYCAGLPGPQFFQRTPCQRIQQFCHRIFAPILFSPVYVQCILTNVEAELSNDFQETSRHRSDTAKQPRIVLQHFGLCQPSF
jgi:hypothetical protein